MKTTVSFEFGSEAEAGAFLARIGGAPAGMAAVAPSPPPVQPVAPPPPPQAYAPQAPQPTAAAPYTPPAAMQPAPAAAAPQLPPGVPYQPVAPNGQPWTPTTIMPLMQQYGGSAHGTAGVQGVFKRYGFEPNITKLDANQLAVIASHFASMQPA